jgi:GNAT superfamily N-acetyltransferase
MRATFARRLRARLAQGKRKAVFEHDGSALPGACRANYGEPVGGEPVAHRGTQEQVAMTVSIRPVTPGDRARWEPLFQGYLAFYKTSLPASTIDLTWSRFFDGIEPVHALVAEDADGRLVGMVHYLYHRNTWMVGPVCYLQDLFTAPEARGRGVGRALIEAVYAAAKAAGSPRVYWTTHETNSHAMLLYDKVAEKSGFIQYRKAL